MLFKLMELFVENGKDGIVKLYLAFGLEREVS